MSWHSSSQELLHCVAALLDSGALARLRRVNKFIRANVRSEETVRYIASLRGTPFAREISSLEQIALVEALHKLKTDIRFRFQDVRLDDSSRAPLRSFAALLLRHSTFQVSIEGHCGLEAPRRVGFLLTCERARAVKAALVFLGVAAARLRIVGFSNTRPVVWDFGDDGPAALNRRVELFVKCGGFELPKRKAREDYAVAPPGAHRRHFAPATDRFDTHGMTEEDLDNLGVMNDRVPVALQDADGALAVDSDDEA
ncbi:hypothetical protein M885DRAFT_517237 [Pelagophyceae sp. CCMP2097]|nr:hypothetical protein M885DRAFT_517237 [Pelagophyceae sp. CCMP2097]